jgi:hypothetical protein
MKLILFYYIYILSRITQLLFSTESKITTLWYFTWLHFISNTVKLCILCLKSLTYCSSDLEKILRIITMTSRIYCFQTFWLFNILLFILIQNGMTENEVKLCICWRMRVETKLTATTSRGCQIALLRE